MANRIPISNPELTAVLQDLGRNASLIETTVADLLENRQLPYSSLPSLNAARRSATSLLTHLGAGVTLSEAE